MKTNKSFTKRIRVTRKGKLVARKAGQDHFNAKERSRTKNAKKRAKVAVARKLAVLMHRLWVTGEVYEPLRNANRQAQQEQRATA